MDASPLPKSNFEVRDIRKHAKQSIDKGVVTIDYPLDRVEACKILNRALAGEILCVLRYQHHLVSAKGIDFPQVAAQFSEHAADEQKHVLMLAERIHQLGGRADFNPANLLEKSATEYGDAGDLLAMIEEDLVAERIAIELYRHYVKWFGNGDPTTRRMLESILEDEEDHADEMLGLLDTINRSNSWFKSKTDGV